MIQNIVHPDLRIGASLAFLVARYIARDWVAAKLTGPKWDKLDSEVAQHGWKVVTFTRLIFAFPFNLLNRLKDDKLLRW